MAESTRAGDVTTQAVDDARSIDAPAVQAGAAAADDTMPGDPFRRPNLRGDLELLLTPPAVFRTRLLGYDRFEVDSYVTWVEAEIGASRRANGHLAAELGRCFADLQAAERRAARIGAGPDATPLSDRLRDILQLAMDEAAELRVTATAEAQRLRDEARARAEATLQEARSSAEAILSSASAERDQLDSRAAQDRRTAAEESARRIAEREKAAGARREAAEAAFADRMATAQREFDVLKRHHAAVIASCHSLQDQIHAALHEATNDRAHHSDPT